MDAQPGYDPDRFISTVPRRLLCSICYHVLEEPRLCKDGEHCFCLSCISQHLNESHTCPVCRKDLTPETLVHPQRYLKENLGELQIKCDYIERGCPDHIQLGNLQDHVNNCGFAPVTCEQCEMQINRKDKDNHEKSFCQLGAAKCQNCENIKAGQDEIKVELCQVKTTQGEMKENQDLMKIQLDEILNDQRGYQMRENVDEIKQSQDEMKAKQDKLKRQITGIKRKQDEIDSNVNGIKDEMKSEMVEVKRRQDEIDDKVNKIMDSVDEIKKAQVEMRNETIQQFENFTKMLTQVEYRAFLSFSSTNEIMVMGGANEESDGRQVIVNSASILDFSDGTWNELPPMNQCRLYAASFVYNNDIFVTGGADGQDSLDSIEILKKKQHPSRWTIFGGKLPVGLCHHDVVVYQNQLYTIGGCIGEQGATNAIYKLPLTPPYAADILTTMPQPRMNHRAEIVNDKLYVLGKGTTGNEATDSVVVYDFAANRFDTCEPLPKPADYMSTVTWGNKIIVIGGRGEERNELNDVIMYDTETERSETLPSLNHRRHGHSAVIMNDVIVVLGGKNRQGYLKSVERFTIGSDRWIELPGMKEKKHSATAVVKPCN